MEDYYSLSENTTLKKYVNYTKYTFTLNKIKKNRAVSADVLF